ncbi:MAG: iron-sulfur cluster insertion protein ErpA [Actinomycetota bacterium]|jgi:iron-sulfur cluster assembly protein/iron-sulfur cluster insertion protein|nr:iron-sulfur cluster insertion protein ErpA [Actinomycetota bacterium]
MQGISITPRASAPQVTLTSAAAAKVTELLEREDEKDLVLRLGVRPGGCSGFSYEMFFDANVDDSDFIAETDGVRMAVDSQSLEMLKGAQVDYRDGLQGAGFHIENPNVSRACGCGNSFS